MSPSFLLVFFAFLDCQRLASAENESSPPLPDADFKNLQYCLGKNIEILCKAREETSSAGELLLADCYMLKIGNRKRRDVRDKNLLLKVEKNTTVDDEEGTHLTAKLQFQTDYGATREIVDAIFKYLIDKNERDFNPCPYLDIARKIITLAAILVVVQLVMYYVTKNSNDGTISHNRIIEY